MSRSMQNDLSQFLNRVTTNRTFLQKDDIDHKSEAADPKAQILFHPCPTATASLQSHTNGAWDMFAIYFLASANPTLLVPRS